MHRATSASSEQDESSDIIQQEEYANLKINFIKESNEKKKLEEAIKADMLKLKEEINLLNSENEELKTNLNQAESDKNKKDDEKSLGKLKELVKKYDQNNEKIEQERQNSNSLDAKIRNLEKKVNQQKVIKDNPESNSKETEVSEVRKRVDRKTVALENRYDKQMKNYNNTLTSNADLRDEIEKLRNERVIYNNLYKQLDQELEVLRKEKAEITDAATVAYDQRAEANSKCTTLKDKNDKDRAQHETEMRDWQRIIDHDYILRDFMNTKSDERFEWKQVSEERRRKHGSSGEIARRQQRKQIETYESAFNRIKIITEEEDIDILVKNFIQNEDDNFALFQYVNELNNQIEIYHEDIAKIKLDIENHKLEEDGIELDRHKQLKELESQYNKKKNEADRAQTRLTEINKILDQVRDGVQSIFSKISCEESVIKDILGGDSTVTNRNIMLYLGSVEQRTNALLTVLYYTQTKEFDNTKVTPHHGITLGLSNNAKSKAERSELGIYAPQIRDDIIEDSEDSDSNIRPFSQEELRVRAMKDLRKKENSTGRVHRGLSETKLTKKN